jgi:hypothetical protein
MRFAHDAMMVMQLGQPRQESSNRLLSLETGLQIYPRRAECASTMPLLKLTRINKGGELVINSEHILLIEVESRSTTLHMTHNLLFSVDESPSEISEKVERMETARITNALQQSGLATKQPS